jgi:hypothetical protein
VIGGVTETHFTVMGFTDPVGRWCYLYRVIDRDGNLIDTVLSTTRDMKAARRFFRSARSVAGFVPDRVTTDGHNSYPRAIRSTLGRNVRHRTSIYLITTDSNKTIAGSKDASDVCVALRSMRRQTDFAESMMNSVTSSAADPIKTNTFQQPADAVTFSGTPASRWASCRSHNPKIQAARRVANGATRNIQCAWPVSRAIRLLTHHKYRSPLPGT